jgi:hypothetical protein
MVAIQMGAYLTSMVNQLANAIGINKICEFNVLENILLIELRWSLIYE